MTGSWAPRILVLLVLTALLAPGALACATTRGPHSPVRFVATEDGVTVLDLATSISVGTSTAPQAEVDSPNEPTDGVSTRTSTPNNDDLEIPASYGLALLAPAVVAWAIRRRL